MATMSVSSLMARTLVLALCLGAALSAVETVGVAASKTSGVAINETVTVSLVLSGGAPLNAFQGYLEWDKTRLELSSSPMTALVDGNGAHFIAAPGFVLSTAKAAGTGTLAFFTTAGDVNPGSAVMMTWTFKALANGSAVVQTKQASLTNDYTKLSNALGVSRYPVVGAPITIQIGSVGNTAPTISNIADQATSEDVAKAGIAVAVGDAQTAAGSLTLTGTSSNPTLLPNAGIVFGGSGPNRTVTLTPAPNQNGSATVTLTVTDGGGLTANDTFVLTVMAVNDPPTVVHVIPNQTATLGSAFSFAFAADTFADIDGGTLTYSASGLPAGIAFTQATRSFAGTSTTAGSATVTVTANDGAGGTASTTFSLTSSASSGGTNQLASGGGGGGGCGAGGAIGALLVAAMGFLGSRRRSKG